MKEHVTMLKRDGFEGEKLISLPDSIWKNLIKSKPALSQLYVTHIGYFPKASHHYRDRKKGCVDDILIYCLRGKGWYMIGDKRFNVGVNEFFILPATSEPLRYGADEADPWTIYWVHFSGQDIELFNRCFNIRADEGPKSIPLNEKGLEIWNTMYKTLEMGYSTDNLVYINLCLYHFVGTFLYQEKHIEGNKQSSGNYIEEAIQYMRSKIKQRLTIEELASSHHLSPSHFSFLFRRATGMAPLDYFIHLKLQRACLLLHSTDRRIKSIAIDLGYDDAYYFSRLFKKYMKVSPDQYRISGRKTAS